MAQATTKAKLKYLRISPRKTRLIADMVRGLPVREAEAQLHISAKRASVPILKLLKSAVANASHNNKIEEAQLFIKEIGVDQGPTLKRWIPRARGASSRIEKKTSHVTLTLGTKEGIKQQDFVFPKREMKEGKKAKLEQARKEQEAAQTREHTHDEPKEEKKTTRKDTQLRAKRDFGGIKKLFRRNKV